MGPHSTMEAGFPGEMSTRQPSTREYEFDINDLDRMSSATNYRKWLYDVLEPYLGHNVLEIGAGVGDLTEHIAHGRKVFVTDLSEPCLQKLEERFSSWNNVEVSRFDLMNFDLESWQRKRIDTTVSMQLFEHLHSDTKAFKNIFEIMSEGGTIITMVPALKVLYGTIDRALGHYRRYSRKDICDKIEAAGFTVTDSFYFNLIGAIGWFINARILHITTQKSSQIKVFDKVVVPIMSRIEKRLKLLPFGQTVFCVARKPDTSI